MKTFICGGFKYRYDHDDFDALDRTRLEMPISRVLIPKVPGAAGVGWHWALRRKIPYKIYELRDGLPREAESLILFPGRNAYTDYILNQAASRGLEIYDWTNVRQSGKP